MPHVNVFVTIGFPKHPEPIINNKCVAQKPNETSTAIGKTERLRAVTMIKKVNRASRITPAQLYYVVYNMSGQVLAHSVNTPNNILNV